MKIPIRSLFEGVKSKHKKGLRERIPHSMEDILFTQDFPGLKLLTKNEIKVWAIYCVISQGAYDIEELKIMAKHIYKNKIIYEDTN